MNDTEFPPVHVFIERDSVGYYAFAKGFEGCTTRGSSPNQVTGPTMKKIQVVLELLVYIRKMAQRDKLLAVEPLIDMLEQDPNSWVRKEAASSLAIITRQNFGENAINWRNWWTNRTVKPHLTMMNLPDSPAPIPYSRAFVSYLHEVDDENLVDALCTELRKHGVHVFLDRNTLNPGELWGETLRREIQNGSCFIACFSSHYGKRSQTYMEEELAIALEELRIRNLREGWFIPVRLDSTPLPDIQIDGEHSIRDVQWIDLFPNLKDGLNRLLRVVRPPSLAPPEFENLLRNLCSGHIESKIARFTSTKLIRVRDLEDRWQQLLSPNIWNCTVEATLQALRSANKTKTPQSEHFREVSNPECHEW